MSNEPTAKSESNEPTKSKEPTTMSESNEPTTKSESKSNEPTTTESNEPTTTESNEPTTMSESNNEPTTKSNEHTDKEETLWSSRAKLFVYGETLLDKGTGNKTWRHGGVGEMKILQHTKSKKGRLLMHQEGTMKAICNHFIDPLLGMQPHSDNDKAWTWNAIDFSEGKGEAGKEGVGKEEGAATTFAILFETIDAAAEFAAECKKISHESSLESATPLKSAAVSNDSPHTYLTECATPSSCSPLSPSGYSPVAKTMDSPTNVHVDTSFEFTPDAKTNGLSTVAMAATPSPSSTLATTPAPPPTVAAAPTPPPTVVATPVVATPVVATPVVATPVVATPVAAAPSPTVAAAPTPPPTVVATPVVATPPPTVAAAPPPTVAAAPSPAVAAAPSPAVAEKPAPATPVATKPAPSPAVAAASSPTVAATPAPATPVAAKPAPVTPAPSPSLAATPASSPAVTATLAPAKPAPPPTSCAMSEGVGEKDHNNSQLGMRAFSMLVDGLGQVTLISCGLASNRVLGWPRIIENVQSGGAQLCEQSTLYIRHEDGSLRHAGGEMVELGHGLVLHNIYAYQMHWYMPVSNDAPKDCGISNEDKAIVGKAVNALFQAGALYKLQVKDTGNLRVQAGALALEQGIQCTTSAGHVTKKQHHGKTSFCDIELYKLTPASLTNMEVQHALEILYSMAKKLHNVRSVQFSEEVSMPSQDQVDLRLKTITECSNIQRLPMLAKILDQPPLWSLVCAPRELVESLNNATQDLLMAKRGQECEGPSTCFTREMKVSNPYCLSDPLNEHNESRFESSTSITLTDKETRFFGVRQCKNNQDEVQAKLTSVAQDFDAFLKQDEVEEPTEMEEKRSLKVHLVNKVELIMVPSNDGTVLIHAPPHHIPRLAFKIQEVNIESIEEEDNIFNVEMVEEGDNIPKFVRYPEGSLCGDKNYLLTVCCGEHDDYHPSQDSKCLCFLVLKAV